MAAWGVTGRDRAPGSRWSRGRRIGRWPLALVCAVVGFAFTAVQDVGDWVTYSDHSLAQLGVYVGKGLGFDAIHAAGCLVFALAFGPALMRSIARFATRLQVTWQPPARRRARRSRSSLAVGGLAGRPARRRRGRRARPPATSCSRPERATAASAPRPASPRRAVLRLGGARARRRRASTRRTSSKDGHSLLGYIELGAGAASDPGSLERTILVAARRRAAGRASAGATWSRRSSATSVANGSVVGPDQPDRVRGARAARGRRRAAARERCRWLVAPAGPRRRLQLRTAGGASDVDDTGAALEALAGTAPGASTRARAVALHRAASRTATAASRASRAPARTPSRRRWRSRACSRPASTRRAAPRRAVAARVPAAR